MIARQMLAFLVPLGARSSPLMGRHWCDSAEPATFWSSRVLVLCVCLLTATWAWAQDPVIDVGTIAPTAEDQGEVPFPWVNFGDALGISGSTAMAGMPLLERGKVGVYELSSEGWQRTATLVGSKAGDSEFGTALDLDGNVAVISSPQMLYFFKRKRSQWRELAHAQLPADMQFSQSLAHEGGYIAVGVTPTDPNTPTPGAVHIYRYQHGNPRLQKVATLRSRDCIEGDGFGASVAMEHRLLVVGAPGSCGEGGTGAAYVFIRVRDGWFKLDKLMPSDAYPGGGFGTGLAIRKGAIVIGAPNVDTPENETLAPEGAAYVFLLSRRGWFESQKLNTGSAPPGFFGTRIAMARGLVAISAPLDVAARWGMGRLIIYDWVGRELQFGRRVFQFEGLVGIGLDASGRRVIVNAQAVPPNVEVQNGYARIFTFGTVPGSAEP